MTGLATLLDQAEPIDGGFRTHVPDDWKQGRTAYGGWSSAMALAATLRLEPDLPPLRSAQIAFVGPLSGDVRVTASRLRRGRNAAFMQADVSSDAGLGLRATFVFMRALASAVEHSATPPAPSPPPDDDRVPYIGPPGFFAHSFEFVDRKDASGPAEWRRWARLRERDGLHPTVELLAIADALPPAAFRLADRRVPLSSLTWIVNLLDPAPSSRTGWYLLSAGADHARDGYSSQSMRVWNDDGALVAEGMQGVAIFG